MMINQVIRYVPIVNILKNGYLRSGIKILEVGSGSNGIGDYIQFEFVGCDIKFEGKINPNLLPVIGSAELLPFRDNIFDAVVSSDMLEHIENKKRAKVIDELVRISKDLIIIGCPCGKKSESCEQKIALWYQLTRRKYPDWLSEHLENGLPSESEIRSILNEKKLSYHVVNNENTLVHLLVIIFESTPIIGNVLSKLARLFLTILTIKPTIFKFLNFGTPYRKIFTISRRVMNNVDK